MLTGQRELLDLFGMKEVEPGYILGTLKVFGANHHAEFIRVVEDEDGCHHPWEPGEDEECNANGERFDALQGLYEARRYDDFEIPGYPGRWIFYSMPFEV